MSRTLSVAVAISCAALFVFVVSIVSAQAVPQRLVQGSDGTVYLVAGTIRYVVNPDPISDDDLAALNDGGSIGAQILLPAIPTAPASVPTTSASPTPVTQSAPALSAKTPIDANGVVLTIISIDRPAKPPQVSFQSDPGTDFVVLTVQLDNHSSQNLFVSHADFQIQGADFVRYRITSAGGVSTSKELDIGTLPPGGTQVGRIVFGLPSNVPTKAVLWDPENRAGHFEIAVP